MMTTSDDLQKDLESSSAEKVQDEKEPWGAKRWEKYLVAEVTTSHADILLLSCSFISGLVDGTIYNAYGTFVSMQTGELKSIFGVQAGPRYVPLISLLTINKATPSFSGSAAQLPIILPSHTDGPSH